MREEVMMATCTRFVGWTHAVIGMSAIAAALGSCAVWGQRFPDRPVRLIIPAPPGGSTDHIGRIVGGKLADLLGQQVVIDNRAGGSGVLGAELTARAQPDGYTLGVIYTGHTLGAALSKPPYDLGKDLAPVAMMTTAPLALVVATTLPVRSVQELIQYVKARPSQLSYASAGNGSGGHFTGEMFKSVTKTDAQHVPFKGAAPAAIEVAGGRLLYQFAAQTTAQGLIKAGRLRVLAVTSQKRSPLLPDIPTMVEAGLPGFEFLNWFGIVGPARIAQPIIGRLNADIVKVLGFADVRERLANEGNDPAPMSPAEFGAFLQRDLAKWAKIAVSMKMTAD
jgi:tripartite-type tricarboxylate transporter receptor subunit TctC